MKQRTTEVQRLKEWSKKHGKNDYCSGRYDLKESLEDLPAKRSKSTSEAKCKCGSLTRVRTTYRDCPLNRKNLIGECSPVLRKDHADVEEFTCMWDTPMCTFSFSELSCSDEDVEFG